MRWELIGLIVVISFMLMAIDYLHPFGAPINAEMDDYFIANAQLESAANNVVTSIVFDYRGIDTLGEATVLFTAVTGVYLLLGVTR